MIFSKLRTTPGMAFAFAIVLAFASQTVPVSSQEQQPPASEGEQAAPPAAEGTGEPAAPEAPAQDGAMAPSAEPSQETGGAAAGEGSAEVPPVHSDAPAAAAEPAPSEGSGGATVNASQIQIGAAVFGSDGAKIGEINGVKSDDSGKVQEILVTNGMPAGINAKVFEISADKITSVGDGVKLSLSSEEAKQLPIVDKSSG